jgi:segregation and condensation protein A
LVDIARAAGRALAPTPHFEIDTSHVAEVVASVRAAIVELAEQLREAGTSTFRALCASAGSRIEVVARFLALLELYKGGAVDLDQSERFGDIQASWIDEVEVDAVLQEAEEYSAAERRQR